MVPVALAAGAFGLVALQVLLYFRSMVAREVEGPLCLVPVVGRKLLLGHCGRSWDALGAYVGGPGPLLGPTNTTTHLRDACTMCVGK